VASSEEEAKRVAWLMLSRRWVDDGVGLYLLALLLLTHHTRSSSPLLHSLPLRYIPSLSFFEEIVVTRVRERLRAYS
jgi:hypothetical protein